MDHTYYNEKIYFADKGKGIVDNLHRMSIINQQILSAIGNIYTAIYQIDITAGEIYCFKDDMVRINYNSDCKFNDWIKTIVPQYHPDDRDKLAQFLSLEKLADENALGTKTLEADFRCGTGGNYSWVANTLIFDRYNDSQELVILVQRDVSSRYEWIQPLEDELECARNSNTATRDFLTQMSRDIRIPLNAIISMTKLAIANMEDIDKLEKYLYTVNESGNHLLEIMDKILDMNEIESGEAKIQCDKFRIDSLIKEIQSIIEPDLMAKSQNLVVQYSNIRHTKLMGDKVRLHKIMVNLISNASKFSYDGSEIEFTITELPVPRSGYGQYRFEVRDYGIGIDENMQDRIFEPFARTDDSGKSRIPYAGLGLAVTKNIIDMMKGNIKFESTVGEGSCFTVILELKLDTEGTKPEIYVDNDISGMKILLVEDNELNMEIACEMLGMNDAVVTTACNGQEAIDVFKSSGKDAFDLIMMDIQMPVKNGYEAVDGIRELADIGGDRIPVIAVTAEAFSNDIRLAGSHGMNGYITKPLDFEQVKATLAKFKNKCK